MKWNLEWKNYLWTGLLFFPMFSFHFSEAQNKTVADYLSVNGYIKDLSAVSIVNDINSLYPSTLLHNRINLALKPVSHLSIVAGIRTRMLISDEQALAPGFAQEYTHDNGFVNMSFNWVNKYPVIFNTTIDRLYIDWTDNKWDARVGRQRLNWGINLTWNPNDIFNTYNFLDFDYEERPGTDAAKIQYNFTSFSNLEVAFSPAHSKDSLTGALKYTFNTHNYDLQYIGGNYYKDVVIGMGWAGNIKDAGFKGELSYFQNRYDNRFANIAVCFSTTVDYSFKNGWYLMGTLLYNNAATDSLFSVNQLESESLSPKMLMPTKYNFMVQTSKQFTPVLNGGFALIFCPKANLLILNPTLSYNIATNWDLDLIIQSFFANNTGNKFDVLGNTVNLRLRWSFSN